MRDGKGVEELVMPDDEGVAALKEKHLGWTLRAFEHVGTMEEGIKACYTKVGTMAALTNPEFQATAMNHAPRLFKMDTALIMRVMRFQNNLIELYKVSSSISQPDIEVPAEWQAVEAMTPEEKARMEVEDDVALSPADLAWQRSAAEGRSPTPSEIAEGVKEGPGFLERTALGEQQHRMEVAMSGPKLVTTPLDVMRAAVALSSLLAINKSSQEDSQPTRKKKRVGKK